MLTYKYHILFIYLEGKCTQGRAEEEEERIFVSFHTQRADAELDLTTLKSRPQVKSRDGHLAN